MLRVKMSAMSDADKVTNNLKELLTDAVKLLDSAKKSFTRL